MRTLYTLTFRVLAVSCLLLIALFGLYTYFAVSFHSGRMMAQVLEHATIVSNIVRNSTHYSMLRNQSREVEEIIDSIGREPGVEGIRIYNKRGVIISSTDKTEEGKVVDTANEACDVCHDRAEPLRSVPGEPNRIFVGSQGHRVLGHINPIRNEPACHGCHAPDQTVLGVLDVRMSLQRVDADIAEGRRKLIWSAVFGTLLVLVASGVYLTLTVHRPVGKLMEGTRQISAGHLGYRIPLDTGDEIGQLARAFNEMTAVLQRAEEENRLWSQTLEKRIEEKTAELKQIHDQIVQIEKMASLGKLSATVAHELNNPLAGILNYSKLISRRLKGIKPAPEIQSTLADLDLIIGEVQRCGNIVKNLLLFSRRRVEEFSPVPVAGIVDKTVRLVQHHFKISNVNFRCDIADPGMTLVCDENQIQQALMALFVNAVEAMPRGGDLSLTVAGDEGGGIRFVIADTGVGIPAEDIPHLFEPFFTSKKEGKGVGLGLSVVYGILERHDALVSVQSEPGKGTTFTLRFPPAAKPRSALKTQESVTY